MTESSLAGLAVLMVEDEALLRKRLCAQLEKLGADVTAAGTVDAARRFAAELSFDCVLLDVNLPDGKGTDLLAEKIFGAAAVVVMTADGGVAGAVEAMRLGALDYMVKPFEPEELPLVIARARRMRQSARVEEHRRNDEAQSGGGFFFGSALGDLERQLERILVADRRMQGPLPPVLIQGETGTGKTTIARWLHHRGPRGDQPLVEMNCSAVPETLAESELFGHERGAFTDARTARLGLFEAANGGTLFLDELPSLSPALQAKVLKAIEDHRIRRLGGNKEIPVDVRIIAATHQDLRKLVAAGQFREDLFHRLDLYRVNIAPLRERGDDLIALAEVLMTSLCRRHRLPRRTISPEGQRRLLAHRWPGNVRELAHELERAIVFQDGDRLEFDHLEDSGGPGRLERAGNSTDLRGLDTDQWLNPAFRFPADGFSLEEAINRMIALALQQTNGNVSGAARLLGVSRDYVRYRLAAKTDH